MLGEAAIPSLADPASARASHSTKRRARGGHPFGLASSYVRLSRTSFVAEAMEDESEDESETAPQKKRPG